MNLKSKTGVVKAVRQADPVWDTLDNCRLRFSRCTLDGAVVLMTDEGKELPDYRHHSQVLAY